MNTTGSGGTFAVKSPFPHLVLLFLEVALRLTLYYPLVYPLSVTF